MKIHEVMKMTGLTKKAIYYYEDEGLIQPEKEPENQYRIYREADVKQLRQIQLLRQLDIPVEAIRKILKNPGTTEAVLQGQLESISQKISLLSKNKEVIERLAHSPGKRMADLSPEQMGELHRELAEEAKSRPDYMRAEIQRIFPGCLGKLMAIFYSSFLDHPLDTEEKEDAWNALVAYLDGAGDISYPEDIRQVIDEVYAGITENQLTLMKQKSRTVVDSVIARKGPPDQEQVLKAQKALEDYYRNPDNRKKEEGFKKLQAFMLSYQSFFKGIDEYLQRIDERYRQYMGRITAANEINP